MDIQVGDKVTYKINDIDDVKSMIIYDYCVVENFNDLIDSKVYKILKIERPKYEVIEDRKELLTEEEKKYLKSFIKPFKDKIRYIRKYNAPFEAQYISIQYKNDEDTDLPCFENNTLYKGMEVCVGYTLKELGLEG